MNSIIDLQFIKFNDCFNEVNSELLTYVAAFNPKNSFDAFKFESSMELANAYPSDLIQMSQTILVLSFIFILIMCEPMQDLPNWILFLNLVDSWWIHKNILLFLWYIDSSNLC